MRAYLPTLLAGLLSAACGGSDGSALVPEGPPEVLQIFVRDGNGVSRLAAGHHCDIDDLPSTEHQDCSPGGPAPPHAGNAGPVDARSFEQGIRVVFDEPLQAGTVEPAPGSLQPGVATLRCRDTDLPVGENEGAYQPGGDQGIGPSGVDGLGPALILRPLLLPTTSDCTVVIGANVSDPDGNAVTADVPLTFRTEALRVTSSTPADGATGVATTASLAIAMNAPIGSWILDTSIEVRTAAGDDFPGDVVVEEATPEIIHFTPVDPLPAGTRLEVTVTTGVQDSFGVSLPVEQTFSFTTGS